MGSQRGACKVVFEEAQSTLRSTFGTELVDVLPRMIPPEFYGQGEGPGEGRDAERRGWRQAVTGLKKKGAVPSPL